MTNDAKAPHEEPVDESVPGLVTRMKALEEYVFGVLVPTLDRTERALESNTALTEETHGWMGDMHELFETARNGFRLLGRIGNGFARVGRWLYRAGEFLEKLSRPLFLLALLSGIAWSYLTSGKWQMPTWLHWWPL